MPAFPSVLAKLADSLVDNGVNFGAASIRDISSVLSFLQTAGVNPDDESATAAIAAILLPPDDARRFVAAFGLPPELLPALAPSPIGILDDQLFRIINKGSRSQALVAAAMLFAWYCSAARRGDKTRMDGLRPWINLIVPPCGNADLGPVLTSQIQNIEIEPSSLPMRGNCLFSISIDLVGSTEAKTRVMRVGQGHSERIDYFNAEIYRKFCKIEEDFYRIASHKIGAGKPIDLKRFFAVKGIGDEIWLLCEAQPNEIESTGVRLIDAALQIAATTVDFFATEHTEPDRFDPGFDYGEIEPVCSPIKIFIDAIDHASNLGKIRDDRLFELIPQLLQTSYGSPAPPAEIARVSARLCFGTSESTPWSRIQLYRTDYIGHEIDRFFRSTKAALPGTVAIGEAMVTRVGLRFSGPDDAIMELRDHADAPLRGGNPSDPIHCRLRTLSEAQMKGIGYPYKSYLLFAPRQLNGLYTTSHIRKERQMPAPNYEDTQAVLSTDQVRAKAELYYPKPAEQPNGER